MDIVSVTGYDATVKEAAGLTKKCIELNDYEKEL